MAKEVINIGTGELTGDGETLRSALNKVNLNFTELYADDLLDFDGKFGSLTEKPTTLAGYGITDAATSAQGTKADNALQPTDISVSTLANAGSGTLTYVGDQAPNTGVLTYTPPDLSGLVLSNTTEVAIGSSATAGLEAVSIGKNAGDSGDYSQAIGNNAGNTGQGVAAVALGSQSGETSQGNKAVAVGQYAGQTSQGADATAIGAGAGKTSQGGYATAIGKDAGQISQSAGGVAIGRSAGYSTQGLSGIAIGYLAGESNQGAEAIAIGANAGTANQAANSIILNAAGATLQNTQASSFVVKPIRNASGTHSLEYNPTTGEVTYDTAGGGASDTDALPEGTTNLYYTDARVNTYLSNNDYDTATNIVASITDSAPGTLNTLNELASALGDDANYATTTATSIAEKLPLAGGTMTGDIDGGGNKVLFANLYATEGDLPSATTYHGMFAHVHGTGAGYFAHAGNWIKLANYTDLSAYQTTGTLGTNIDLHLNQASAGASEVLSWNGSDYAWVAQSGGGGSSNAISQGNSNVTVTDTGSDGTITFDTEGTDRWQVTSAGHIIPQADTAYDIGNASNKVRHFYLSDSSIKWGAAELPMTVVDSRLHFNSIKVLTETSTTDTNINVSGAGLGIKIGQASTSGSTISIGSEVNTTTVSMNGLTDFNARATFDRGVAERFYTITGATGTVIHNCQWGHIWYHTGVTADFTANITNLALTQEDTTNVAVVVNQGGTGYIPNAVEIDGVAQTIVWQSNSAPTATDNGVDTFSFTIMNDGGTYMVLGQSTSFGGV